MRTVSGALFAMPSLTTSCTSYDPATSATNVGRTACGSDNTAALEPGFNTNDQVNVSASPSASLDAPPFSVTRAPSVTVRSGPALAIGSALAVPQLWGRF